MIKHIKMIKTVFILGLLLISLFVSFTPKTTARDPPAFVAVDLKWSEGFPEKPIVPRGEIVELGITAIMRIETNPNFGAGLLEGYEKGGGALIAFSIVDYPSWCSVVLRTYLIMTNISDIEEASTTLFLHVNENAPAYANGIIRVKVNIGQLGLIQGTSKEFDLPFKPAYFPIIKTDLPETNSKRIDPSSEAVFPIEVENAGNAETKVFLKVLNVPDGWSATVTDFLILGEAKGSKGTAYLNVLPSRGLGYHYDEAHIVVEIIPAFAENVNLTGKPIFANFIVKNRGFSSSGIEFYLIIAVIIIIIIAFILTAFRRKRKK